MAWLDLLTLAAAPLQSIPHWRPFIDPIDLHGSFWLGGWTLLLPMSLGIAIIYKAVRVPEVARQDGAPPAKGAWWSLYWRQVLVLTVQIVVSMMALALATYLLVEVYVRWVQERG